MTSYVEETFAPLQVSDTYDISDVVITMDGVIVEGATCEGYLVIRKEEGNRDEEA